MGNDWWLKTTVTIERNFTITWTKALTINDQWQKYHHDIIWKLIIATKIAE